MGASNAGAHYRKLRAATSLYTPLRFYGFVFKTAFVPIGDGASTVPVDASEMPWILVISNGDASGELPPWRLRYEATGTTRALRYYATILLQLSCYQPKNIRVVAAPGKVHVVGSPTPPTPPTPPDDEPPSVTLSCDGIPAASLAECVARNEDPVVGKVRAELEAAARAIPCALPPDYELDELDNRALSEVMHEPAFNDRMMAAVHARAWYDMRTTAGIVCRSLQEGE